MHAIGAWFKGDEISGQSTEFRDFTVRSLQREYGPVDGDIDHDLESGTIQTHLTSAWVTDAVIEARFRNPYAASEGSWSSGFKLRRSGSNEFHVVIVNQSGRWFHDVRTGTVESAQFLRAEESGDISTSPAGSNLIRLIALGDEGWLFINGTYIDNLDLSGWDKKGSLAAVGSYFTGDGLAGRSTSFQDFVVWSVGLDGETR